MSGYVHCDDAGSPRDVYSTWLGEGRGVPHSIASERIRMKLLIAFALCVALAFAQGTPANPLVNTSKTVFEISKDDILRSVDKIPENLWTFQPTKEVRTVAQLFAH